MHQHHEARQIYVCGACISRTMPALWPGYLLSPGPPPSSSCTEEIMLIPTLQISAEKGPFGKSKGKKLWSALFPSNTDWLELHVVSCRLRGEWTICSSFSSSVKLSFWCRDEMQAAMRKAMLAYWLTASEDIMWMDEYNDKNLLSQCQSATSPFSNWKNTYKMHKTPEFYIFLVQIVLWKRKDVIAA